MHFGTQDHIRCLQDVALTGPNDESLCLAHKFSTLMIVAGVHLSDDGYVLKIKDKDAYYPMPTGAELASLQQAGALPSQLPPYSISVIDYAVGYSLWIVLLGAVVFAWWAGRAQRRRLAADRAAPLASGPPVVRTPTDRYLADQIALLRRGSEQVTHQAYVLDRVPADRGPLASEFFAVLTTERLLLIKTRLGTFKAVHENLGVREIPRASIAGVYRRDDDLFEVLLADHTEVPIFVPRRSRKLSVENQDAFARDLPRLFVPPAAAPASAVVPSV